MKYFFLLVTLVFSLNALAADNEILVLDRGSKTWESYTIDNRDYYLANLNDSLSLAVCYNGRVSVAVKIIKQLAKNEGLDEPSIGDDGEVLKNTVRTIVRKDRGIRLIVKTQDEHGGYQINRLIYPCDK